MSREQTRKLNNFSSEQDKQFEADIWNATALGLVPNITNSLYNINFSKIKTEWLKSGLKNFIRFQMSTHSFSTCRCYIDSLFYFDAFILSRTIPLKPEQINRANIVEFIAHLRSYHLKTASIILKIINLRTFLEVTSLEGWLPITKERLIYDGDIPRLPSPTPRFIPETVMAQLQKHLKDLPEYHRRLIQVLIETGRRISEICSLRLDCLSLDIANDYFLKYVDAKTKKHQTIPITKECADIIKEQQEYISHIKKNEFGFLFTSIRSFEQNHASARMINIALNQLGKNKNIIGLDGHIWKFSSHQFRHTVGTRMINAGISAHIVQRYLGHESPEMTSRYAHIHDQTLKKAFQEFQGKLVNIHGETISEYQQKQSDAQWLKQNVLAQALPNGYCGLPLVQKRCPHANACLTCTHFKTSKKYLSHHEQQLKATGDIINKATEYGWQRQIEMNSEVKTNLEKIISSLNKEDGNE